MKNLLSIMMLSVFLTACGGGGGSSNGNATQNTTISGSSYKGIISDAVIEVYDFLDNKKGSLLSSGVITDSSFSLPNIKHSGLVLIEVKKNSDNTASFIDEDTGNNIIFNNLVLKSIVSNPKNEDKYTATPLTTLATELVINGKSKNIDEAQKTIAKLFGLSFNDLNKIKPNIENLGSTTDDSVNNEYALSLLSLIAFQNEIDTTISDDFSFSDLMTLIVKDLDDGILDGKQNGVALSVSDGTNTFSIGDIPTKISQAGLKSLSGKNPQLLDKMSRYFLRARTASRTIEPPTIDIRGSANIKLNEKTFFSAQGSNSPFGYPLTYAWSVKNSPANANTSFTSTDSVNTFITVDTEGSYTISVEVSDGQNRTSKDINIVADLDGDGLLGSEDLDRDGDGILNTNDKFPDDISEFLDSDNNGVGNFTQLDEDNDGTTDENDGYPFDNTKSQISTTTESEYNGNLNDANTLSGSMPYKVSGAINASGSDDDYFKFNSTSGAIVSIKLDKTYIDFNPIVSLVDNSGNSILAINSIKNANTVIYSFRTPLDGLFTAIISEKDTKSSASNTYTASIFIDSDIDGVADDYEQAIGSNKNSSDTDGDGIQDYYEIYTSNFDIDGDSIPNWLDSDSDNDYIPDYKEILVDYDNDGLLNPFDTDSDSNGILDMIEVGTNPIDAIDTDGDGFADYFDNDDDNDGVLDINDNNSTVKANIDDNSSISVQGIINTQSISNFAQSTGEIEITGESFSNDALVVLVHKDGVYNLTPSNLSTSTITATLPNITGNAQIRIYDNDKLSISSVINIIGLTDPAIFDISYPNNQTYALENDVVTLTGINLSTVTTVRVNGVSVNVDSATNSEVRFTVGSNLSSGSVIADSLNASSNDLSVFIGRQITGTVELPTGSNYSFANLKVDFAGVESSISNDGSFSMIVKNNKDSSITIFTPDDGNGNVSMYLSALVLSTTTNTTINADSTAIDIMYSALGLDSVTDKSKQGEILQTIQDNIGVFSNDLKQKLGNNPHYISKASNEYIDALSSSKKTISTLLEGKSLIGKSSINRSIFVNEIDDVSVFKDGDPINGEIRIDNDTMLFLDYMIVNAKNGKVIKSYLNQHYGSDLIGPQDPSFFMYWASESSYDVEFQNSKITVITPKFRGMTTSNFNSLPQYKLALRTVLSQGIFPIVNEAIGFTMSDGTTKILLEKILIPAINGGAIDYWRDGKVGEGFYQFLRDLIQALGTDAVKAILKNQMSLDSKAIAKILSKVVGFAVPTKAVSVAGTAVDLGKTVIDFATIKDEIVFNVNFPITIDEIQPTSIKKENSDKRVLIKGKGLEDYCSNFDLEWINGTYLPPKYKNVCQSWHYPKITISSNNKELEVDLKTDKKGYYFDIPKGFVEQAVDDISVKVNHVHNDEQYLHELVDITIDAPEKINIVDKLTISSLSPNNGGSGSKVIISGSGFSSNRFENTVYFTTSSGVEIATVIKASESSLEVQAPRNVVTGNVWVKVDNEDSNTLTFTVSTSQVTIRFGDNGGITDDTFALEFEGKTIKTMASPVVSAYGTVEMNSGQNYTVRLKGITAPDNIGTYYIDFPSEVEVVSGSSLSGSDLTAGVVKSWVVRLSTSSSSLNRSINQSIKYIPGGRLQLQPE